MYVLKNLLSIIVVALCFWILPVSAVDIAAGEQKAANCIACHGSKGKSSAPEWPNLAAQSAPYIVNQLHAFKAGARKNSVMQAMAANLSEDEISNLAAYFLHQSPVSAGGDPELAKLGQSKAAMCLGCHGSSAEGNGQFPRLAGQHPNYLVKQLQDFKGGIRKGGPMGSLAGSLSEDDMKRLAAYFGSIK